MYCFLSVHIRKSVPVSSGRCQAPELNWTERGSAELNLTRTQSNRIESNGIKSKTNWTEITRHSPVNNVYAFGSCVCGKPTGRAVPIKSKHSITEKATNAHCHRHLRIKHFFIPFSFFLQFEMRASNSHIHPKLFLSPLGESQTKRWEIGVTLQDGEEKFRIKRF